MAGEIPRDRWGRPLVVPPGGGKPAPYTRVTTFIDVLDDKRALTDWMKRMVAIGLSERPDLLLAVSAHRDNKDELNRIAEEALEAAKGKAAATTGTALHALTEQNDRGMKLPPLPNDAARDLDAYRRATQDMEMLHIEDFVVHDGLKVGGTPDRIVRWGGHGNLIADIKTGDIKYGAGKIAMQIALYSRSVFYDPGTGQRVSLPDVDQERGLVIHLPAGTGECALHWVDLRKGWEGVELAATVRRWRAHRTFMDPIPGPVGGTEEADDRIAFLVRNAGSVQKLNALWRDHQGEWTDRHTELAAHRKRELLAKGIMTS